MDNKIEIQVLSRCLFLLFPCENLHIAIIAINVIVNSDTPILYCSFLKTGDIIEIQIISTLDFKR